jgi:predicted transposase/invertase (TIGR01784 family)
LDAYSDEHTHEYLLAQAKEEGIKEGIKEGIEEGVVKVARNLLERGFDMETIIQVSGLSREDIDKLR